MNDLSIYKRTKRPEFAVSLWSFVEQITALLVPPILNGNSLAGNSENDINDEITMLTTSRIHERVIELSV